MGKSGAYTTDPLNGGGTFTDGDATSEHYGVGDAHPYKTWGDNLAEQGGVPKNPWGGGYSPVAQQYGADVKTWNETNAANRPDINSAFGNQAWTKGADGSWQLSTGFNGQLGAANNTLQSNYANALAQPLNGDAARNQAIDASYGQATSRLDPQWDKREAAQRTQLLNQGLDPSSEAGKSAMQDFGMQRNDAYGSAMNSAIMQGNQAGNDVFRNNLQGQQSYVDQMNHMNNLLDTPKYNVSGEAPNVQILQSLRDKNNIAIGQQARDDKNSSDTASGALAAASAIALAASDERLKTKIVRLEAEALPGVPWATWEWKGVPGLRNFGVIAQDLEKVAPQFVHTSEDGIKMVDYSFVKEASHGHLETVA